MDLKEFNDKIQNSWSQMKELIERQQTEIKQSEASRGETKAALEKASKDIQGLEDEVRSLKATAGRPILAGMGGGYGGEGFAPRTDVALLTKERQIEHEMYFKALRLGISNLESDERQIARKFLTGTGDRERATIRVVESDRPGEQKALSLGDETAGGYLAPPEYVQDIIKGVQLISPIRPLAQVRNTTRRSVQYPVRSGVFAAKWVAETGTRSETTGLSYALEEIPNHEMYADVLVSDQDLEDSAFNLEQEILDNCTEQFAKAEGAAFVNGTGNGQPEGLLTNTSVTKDTWTAANGGWDGTNHVIKAAALLGSWGNLKTVYSRNATWLMNRKTIVAVRSLVDSQGRYLWEPGLADGTPPNLLGSPYIEVPDMPDIPGSGTATAILYGNVKRAYLIIDRINVVVRRLQEKYAESGQIAYLVRKRVGGQVVLPEALRAVAFTFS